MSATDTDRTPSGNEDQRRELEAAERKANEQQPGSFEERAIDDKIVQVDEIGPDDSAIKGLDPK